MFRLASLLLLMCSTILHAAETKKPNIVFFIADDLGYADLGCYGQKKIRTPNIDKLAAEGMRMLTHYSGNAVCAPSRCVLMTGMNPGHAFIRDNKQFKPGSEGQYPIPADTVTLAELLQAQGYITGAFGKWGLGAPNTSGEPLKQGINRFYGYNCQGVAHNYYPTHLWDNQKHIEIGNRPFASRQKLPEGKDPNDPASYAPYRDQAYAPDLITEQALKFISDHQNKPFFLFYPTTVPHLALQIPDDSLQEYAGKFKDTPYIGGNGYLPNLTPHATYAAMITRLDREIGRMIELVQKLGLEDNTIFVFVSDNGPLYNKLGGTDSDYFQSAGSFRGRKGSLYEGGVRVPCIIRWKGKIAPGSTSQRVTGFEDWIPTLLELVGAEAATPKDIDGISFAPTLFGKQQAERDFLYREFPGYGGQQSVRVGNWKAVRQNLNPRGKKAKEKEPTIMTELYNLADDPNETTDVAKMHPDLVKKLEEIMAKEHVRSEVFPIYALDGMK